MNIVTNINDLKQALPNQGTIGRVLMNRKADGVCHAGHEAVVNNVIANCDHTLMNIWGWEPVYNVVFPNNGVVVDDHPDANWDPTYMTTWAENLGVDTLFLADEQGTNQLISFLANNVGEILLTGDTLISAEGYDQYQSFIDPVLWDQLRMKIGIQEKWSVQAAKYGCDYQCESYKDGIWSFIYKHYLDTHYGLPCTLIEPVKRPDGLPYTSSLNYARQEFIDFAIICHNAISNNLNLVPVSFFYQTDIETPESILPPELMPMIKDENGVFYNMVFDINTYEDTKLLGSEKLIECLVSGDKTQDKPIRLVYKL